MSRTATFKMVDFGSLKALAAVTIDSNMEIRGFKIIDSDNGDGPWVGMPSREMVRDGRKDYIDVVRFVGEDADSKRKEFHNWLIGEYKKAAKEEAEPAKPATLPKEAKKPRKSRKKAVAGPKPATKEERCRT